MSDNSNALKIGLAPDAPEPDPAEAEIAALRAKRAEIASRRQQREDKSALAEQLEQERSELELEEAVDRFEQEFGPVGRKIAVVKTQLGAIILRQSSELKFKRFQDKGTMQRDDVEALVRPCVLYPDMSRFNEIMHDLPATWFRCANQIAVLAGVRIEELQKN